MHWRCLNRVVDLTRPVVMGILNLTSDSFSDGGRYLRPEAALDRAAEMASEGADIIDIGGESTRPGAHLVLESIETERVVPIIERIARTLDVTISIDTSKPGAREWVARSGVGVCLMHMQGEPRTMQHHPLYQDVVAEVSEFLVRARESCLSAGVAQDAIVLDPGVGFGKGLEHNMTLLKELPRLVALGSPLLVGVSRKSFIGRILDRRTEERLYGGLGLAALAVSMGARIIRTHDVAPTRDAIRMVAAVLQGRQGAEPAP